MALDPAALWRFAQAPLALWPYYAEAKPPQKCLRQAICVSFDLFLSTGGVLKTSFFPKKKLDKNFCHIKKNTFKNISAKGGTVKIGHLISITAGFGLVFLLSQLKATTLDNEPVDAEIEVLLDNRDEADRVEAVDEESLAELASDEGAAYTIAGDGRIYRNQAAQIYQPGTLTRTDYRAERSEGHTAGQYPKQTQRDRVDNCPDGVAVKLDGLELCALSCVNDQECPAEQKCKFDVVSDTEKGVCLP